jgi:hypothetical protein
VLDDSRLPPETLERLRRRGGVRTGSADIPRHGGNVR